jgi:signal transduction histidine kinase/DNA-binding response OmpR family regulator
MVSEKLHGWIAAILPQTIRGKLALAFGVVAISAVVGGLVGQSSYRVISEKLAIITETSLPSVIAAQRIGEFTTQIAATGSNLQNVDTEAALAVQQDDLSAHFSQLQNAIEKLAWLSEDEQSVRRLNVLTSEVESTLAVQTKHVAARLALNQQSHAIAEAISHEHLRFNALVHPVINAEKQAFLRLGAGVIEKTTQSVQQLDQMNMKGLAPILLFRVEATNMADAIATASTATTEAELDRLWQSFVTANSDAYNYVKALHENESLAGFVDTHVVEELFSRFNRLGAGDDNEFDRQRKRVTEIGSKGGVSGPQQNSGQMVQYLVALKSELARVIDPMIMQIVGRTATEGLDLNQFVAGTLKTMVTEGLESISDLQQLEALGNQMVGLLTAAARLEDKQELGKYQSRFLGAAGEVEVVLRKYENNSAMSLTLESAHRLIGFGTDEVNVFSTRAAILETAALGEKALGESLHLIEDLIDTAAQIVWGTRADSERAADAAEQSLTAGWWTLVSAITAGLAALLLVWLYTRYSLGVRLHALSEGMLAIAGGNLNAEIPPTGKDEIGRMAEALSTFRDTAVDVKETNLREIREARNRLTDAIESIAEGFALFDAEDRLVICNRRFYELLYPGMSESPEPGIRFETLIRRGAAQGLIEDVSNFASVDDWVEARLAQHRNPSDNYIQRRAGGVWIRVNERRTADGGYVAVYSDLSKEMQRDKELAAAHDEAMQASRAKSEFLANMSHELRTPLNATIGYSELLLEEAEDLGHDIYIADLKKIQAAGKHLLDLINDILDLSKIEAGKIELYCETFNIKQVVDEVGNTVSPLANKNENELVLHCPDDIGDMHSDMTRIRQVLFNLLSNACKFTNKGTITVEAGRQRADDRDDILFTVTDTGIGMKPEQVEHVFEAFTQADSSTTRNYGGTGLGLAITKTFCKMLGGDIQCTSVPAQGTTFSIRIPASAPVQEAEPEEATTATAAGDAQHTVLVIDDDSNVRDLLSRHLSRSGFRVQVAASGEQGLRMAREQPPDAITLDVLMPGMDGWAVLSALKDDPALAEIPVIMVTIVDDQNIGFSLGAAEYLKKPVDRERLLAALAKHCPSARPGNILIVEDDEPTREVLRRVLAKQGWLTTEAGNGRIGLQRLSEVEPDVIVLDLMMPEMNGFEFLAHLRENERWRRIPIIVVTAKTLTADDRKQLEGSVEFMIKKGGHEVETLLEALNSMLTSPSEPAIAKGSS